MNHRPPLLWLPGELGVMKICKGCRIDLARRDVNIATHIEINVKKFSVCLSHIPLRHILVQEPVGKPLLAI